MADHVTSVCRAAYYHHLWEISLGLHSPSNVTGCCRDIGLGVNRRKLQQTSPGYQLPPRENPLCGSVGSLLKKSPLSTDRPLPLGSATARSTRNNIIVRCVRALCFIRNQQSRGLQDKTIMDYRNWAVYTPYLVIARLSFVRYPSEATLWLWPARRTVLGRGDPTKIGPPSDASRDPPSAICTIKCTYHNISLYTVFRKKTSTFVFLHNS